MMEEKVKWNVEVADRGKIGARQYFLKETELPRAFLMIKGISKNKTGNKERTESTICYKIGYLQSTHKLNHFLGLLHFAIQNTV